MLEVSIAPSTAVNSKMLIPRVDGVVDASFSVSLGRHIKWINGLNVFCCCRKPTHLQMNIICSSWKHLQKQRWTLQKYFLR